MARAKSLQAGRTDEPCGERRGEPPRGPRRPSRCRPSIDRANCAETFRPLTRLGDARNLCRNGVSLGLTVVRDAARNHGGDASPDRSLQVLRKGHRPVIVREPALIH